MQKINFIKQTSEADEQNDSRGQVRVGGARAEELSLIGQWIDGSGDFLKKLLKLI